MGNSTSAKHRRHSPTAVAAIVPSTRIPRSAPRSSSTAWTGDGNRRSSNGGTSIGASTAIVRRPGPNSGPTSIVFLNEAGMAIAARRALRGVDRQNRIIVCGRDSPCQTVSSSRWNVQAAAAPAAPRKVRFGWASASSARSPAPPKVSRWAAPEATLRGSSAVDSPAETPSARPEASTTACSRDGRARPDERTDGLLSARRPEASQSVQYDDGREIGIAARAKRPAGSRYGAAQSRHLDHARIHPVDRLTPAAVRSAASAGDAQPPGGPPAPKRPSRRSTPAGNADGVADGTPQQQAEIQLALAAQAARFDAMMKVLAEQQREINAIIDLGMAQAKRDDQLMNEWIRLI